MKIVWIGEGTITSRDREKYPYGYWYASTDDGGYDADGPDPLSAVSNLVFVLEKEIT